MSFYSRLSDNETLMKQLLPIDESFDLIFRHITIGGTRCLLYFRGWSQQR